MAKWALNHYGARSRAAATFLNHAIINENIQVRAALPSVDHNSTLFLKILGVYLMKMPDPCFSSFRIDQQVPVTLKHFQILARLGRAPVSDSFLMGFFVLTVFHAELLPLSLHRIRCCTLPRRGRLPFQKRSREGFDQREGSQK